MRPPPRPRPADGLTLFPTPIGACAVAWSARGLVWIQLPEAMEEATLGRLRRFVTLPEGIRPSAPPAKVERAIDRIVKHLGGRDADLESIALDLEGISPFHRKVYEAARRIGPGIVLSYAELAAEAGSPLASRAVGQAMARNPLPIVVPCHRVVASGGKPGGFSAAGGLDTKARLLAIEGATLRVPARR